MATAADLELFERAYRRRGSADDALLRQVFGEEEFGALSSSKPELVETARAYFPVLTSSTYSRLCREPDNLQNEKKCCEREMEQLAVKNYTAFIGSAKVTQAVKQEVGDIQLQLEEVAEALQPTQDGIQAFLNSSDDFLKRRGALRNVVQQHNNILELLDMPHLLDSCIRNQMYEESLELFAYAGSLLQAHEARGEDIPVLTKLKDQIASQRMSMQASLVAQLATDIRLPECVRIVGFLRRTQRCTEQELRAMFVEHRGNFLEKQRAQVEALRGSRGSAAAALKNAVDLVRTHVYDIGTQYMALFQQEDGPLIQWVTEQISWLVLQLQGYMQVDRAKEGGARHAQFGGAGRVDAATVMGVVRQCSQASTAMRRLGADFFPAVSSMFVKVMEQAANEALDHAILSFHAELGRYDWVASTALGTGAGASGTGAAGWMHPKALDLTRHRPLAVFFNDVVQLFNEVRQCPLHGLRAPMEGQLSECLMAAVNLLRSVRDSSGLTQPSPKATEFDHACRNFAEVLLPLMASLLEAVFGPAAQLDVGAIVATMVPDLVQDDAGAPIDEDIGSLQPGSLAEGSESRPLESIDVGVSTAQSGTIEQQPHVGHPAAEAVPLVADEPEKIAEIAPENAK